MRRRLLVDDLQLGHDLLNLGDVLHLGHGLDGGDGLDLLLVQHLGLNLGATAATAATASETLEAATAPAGVTLGVHIIQQLDQIIILFATEA